MHIGSGSDMEHLGQVCGAMEKAALEVGPSLTSISAGGGLPIDYHEGKELADTGAYYTLWNKTRERLAAAFGHPLSLEIEPGRYLVAESGYLITEIRAVKTSGENTFYLVDAGFNNLARPILYGAYHPMAICPAERLEPSRPRPRPRATSSSAAPSANPATSSPKAKAASSTTAPCRKPSVGDYLVIGYAGAYGYVMANNYNSKPLVAEVLIENGKTHLVRARQTLDDLTRGEVIPK